MALKMDTVHRGFTVPNAIITVEMVRKQRRLGTMDFTVWFSVDGVDEPFDGKLFTAPYSAEGGDDFAQAYAYLKTLPEFDDAVDV